MEGRIDDEVDVGQLNAASRRRLAEVIAAVGPTAGTTSVPACPGWDVDAVVAHLVGVIEDSLAGRIGGPPDDAQSAAQVARHRGVATAALLGRWHRLAPPFERTIAADRIWPALLDVLSHEHDVRHAVALPGARDDPAIVLAARRLAASPGLPAQLCIEEDKRWEPPDRERKPPSVSTTAFEVLRLRLGRRTREEVLALPWCGDPAPIIDQLFVFGPARSPLGE